MKFSITFNDPNDKREADLLALGAVKGEEGNFGKYTIELEDFKDLRVLYRNVMDWFDGEYDLVIGMEEEEDLGPCIFLEKDRHHDPH
jgi:hypothetical protein